MKKVLLLHPDEGWRAELKSEFPDFEIIGGSAWNYPWWEHRKDFENVAAIILKSEFEPGRYAYYMSRMIRNDGYVGLIEGCDYVLYQGETLEKLRKELEDTLPLGDT